MAQQLIFTHSIETSLSDYLKRTKFDRLFVLTDEGSKQFAYPLIERAVSDYSPRVIVIAQGDMHKDLSALSSVWQILSSEQATRHSLFICLGGGMVTDLGGFAAATFKRGMNFINIPTTLLGAVDAAVGGKTGINFNGLKNEVGAFAPADAVIICNQFYVTLPIEELQSGYAEMLKHALLNNNEKFLELLQNSPKCLLDKDGLSMVQSSVLVKERVVEQDPKEQGIRKALNLGHTVGHAFESFSHQQGKPVPHGYAVAWGLVCELLLSHLLLQFPLQKVRLLASYVKEYYGVFHLSCKEYDALYEYMRHDKKNANANTVNFTLLTDITQIKINQEIDQQTINTALDLYRDLMGI